MYGGWDIFDTRDQLVGQNDFGAYTEFRHKCPVPVFIYR